jgi:hypothetical protein
MPEKITLRKPTDISTLVEAGILPAGCLALFAFSGINYLASEENIRAMREQLSPNDKIMFSSGLSPTLPAGTYILEEKQKLYFPDTLDEGFPKQRIWVEASKVKAA